MRPAPTPGQVALFKSCLDAGDAAPFLAALTPAEVTSAGLADFVRAERARLIKLKTLGLSHGWAGRMAVIDAVLARLGAGAGGEEP